VPEQKLCANEGGEGRFYRKPCTPRASPSCAAHDGPARVVVLPRGSLIFHASSPSNPPRFPCAYPFLSDFRGQFWRSSGTQTGSCGISSESSQRPLSNDINFAQIGVRTRELWLPEVGVSELFSCTLPVKIPIKRGMLSANREFHDVAGVIIFPTHPGSRINLLRAGKTLRAKAAVREKKCVLLPARFFSNLVAVRAHI
jgi:hypothetical protein